MGERGPKPQPANVHMLRGNPSKKPLSALLGEFKPEVEIPDAPAFLWPGAKEEWDRITPELEYYGLVSQLDRGLLAMLCQEWARYVWAEEKIATLNKADPQGEAGLIATAPTSGYRMPSVHAQISRRALETYEKLCAHFGLSPSGRTRVTPSDNQAFLPGMEPGADKPKPAGLGKFAAT
jgi:P27 family predicted phage terminase small subunit